jgi:hypothetical protein
MADPGGPPSSATRSLRSETPQRRRLAREASPGVHRHRRPEARPADLAAVVEELVVQSRRAQGLCDHVTDPIALDLVARLVILAESLDEAPQAGVPP